MLFSSVTFLYYFLPVVLGLYFITPIPRGSFKWRNGILLIASAIFYGWGEPSLILLMLAQILAGWLFGLMIGRYDGTKLAKAAMIGSVVVGIGALAVFKYTNFFITTFNQITGAGMALVRLALPLGISFYTFQILSYTIDVYRGRVPVQRNFFTLATYVTLFPQLIAGPIVRYADVAAGLEHREHTVTRFAEGARRFVFGLGKKVLIANVLGELVESLQGGGERSLLAAWLYVAAYGLHVYFDFSGYSDMAIGMGRMLGFDFLENFNYPFIAKSVTDFWRRWHISLGSWFRDYVYIPMGGNRVSLPRQILNIVLVWFLTGFWHGAGWNFIAWGMYFAVLLLIEKFLLRKWLARLPAALSHIYLLFCVSFSWVLFDAASLGAAFTQIGTMFGIGVSGLTGAQSLYYLRSYLVPLIIAVIGCTPLPKQLAGWLAKQKTGASLMVGLEPLTVALLLVVITAYLVDGSFNPFIYFRF